MNLESLFKVLPLFFIAMLPRMAAFSMQQDSNVVLSYAYVDLAQNGYGQEFSAQGLLHLKNDFKFGLYAEQQDRFHIKDQRLGLEAQKIVHTWLTQFGVRLGKEGVLLPYVEYFIQLNKGIGAGVTLDLETKYKNYSDTEIYTFIAGIDFEKFPKFVFVLRTYVNYLEYKRRYIATMNLAGMIKAQYSPYEHCNLYLGLASGQEAIVISYAQGIKNYTFTSSFLGIKKQIYPNHFVNIDYNKTTYRNISTQSDKITLLYDYHW